MGRVMGKHPPRLHYPVISMILGGLHLRQSPHSRSFAPLHYNPQKLRSSGTADASTSSVRLFYGPPKDCAMARNVFACSSLSRQVAPPGSETPPTQRSNGEQPQGSSGQAARGSENRRRRAERVSFVKREPRPSPS